jgi:glycosyltransferase involved in cell wall biosynthesis
MSLRIAMVSEHASPLATLGGADAGGQNVHVTALGEHLAALGAEVTIHTRRDDPALPAQVRLAPGLVVDHVDAGPPEHVPKDEMLPYMARFAQVLSERWSRARPDLVHGHFWMSGLAALDAARPLGIPVVQTFHALGTVKRRFQGVKDTSPPARRHLEPQVARSVDWTIATCSDEVFELVRLGADRRRISVVPCGVDLGRFTPDGPRLPRRPGMRRVVALSRLVERKGVGNAIEAVARLPRVELLVGGGPPADRLATDGEVRRLRGLAERLGAADRVRFLGRVGREEVPPLLRSADVVACVPWYEPFGIVPLEAMACGACVVGSRVGGHIDTIVDGVSGVHVPPRDPDALAATLAILLADPGRRRELGAAAARRARGGYSWRRVARSTSAIYRRVTGGTVAAPARRSGRRRWRALV